MHAVECGWGGGGKVCLVPVVYTCEQSMHRETSNSLTITVHVVILSLPGLSVNHSKLEIYRSLQFKWQKYSLIHTSPHRISVCLFHKLHEYYYKMKCTVHCGVLWKRGLPYICTAVIRTWNMHRVKNHNILAGCTASQAARELVGQHNFFFTHRLTTDCPKLVGNLHGKWSRTSSNFLTLHVGPQYAL